MYFVYNALKTVYFVSDLLCEASKWFITLKAVLFSPKNLNNSDCFQTKISKYDILCTEYFLYQFIVHSKQNESPNKLKYLKILNVIKNIRLQVTTLKESSLYLIQRQMKSQV